MATKVNITIVGHEFNVASADDRSNMIWITAKTDEAENYLCERSFLEPCQKAYGTYTLSFPWTALGKIRRRFVKAVLKAEGASPEQITRCLEIMERPQADVTVS